MADKKNPGPGDKTDPKWGLLVEAVELGVGAGPLDIPPPPASAPPRARTREGLLEELDALQAECTGGQPRAYINAQGKERTKLERDNRIALQCIELKAKLLGLLGDHKNMSLEQLKTELDSMGYELRAKKLKVAR